jgi:hypothetical protein
MFFVHEVVERLDLRRFLEVYSEEGGRLYHPSMMLKVWLYGYALGTTSSRRLEQRIRIKEGRWVRGRKKQARRGRKPNVSPVRQGWVSGGTPTPRSARGAVLDSYQHVFGVVGYASLFQQCQELLLERHLLVMLALIADVGGYLIELRSTHAEGPVSVLPSKCEAPFMHEPRGV